MLTARISLVSLLLVTSCAAQAPSSSLDSILKGGVPKTRDDLQAMAEHNRVILDKVLPATVAVGSSSGVIVPGGFVLTAGHVLQKPGRTMRITLRDGTVLKGESLGLDKRSDSGLIRILTPGHFPSVPMGRSAELELGAWCMMLGHPGGPKPGRTLPVRYGRVLQVPKVGYLVTDCTMSAGDSGGPLFDMQGRVIGINSRIRNDLATNMHVPIDAYHEHWKALVAGEVLGGKPARRVRIDLGFESENTEPGESGILITKVVDGSLAAEGGLKQGDVMLEVAERDVMSKLSPSRLFGRQKSEAVVPVLVMREGAEIELAFSMPKKAPRRPRAASNSRGASRRARPGTSPYSKSHNSVVSVFDPIVAEVRSSLVLVRCDGEDVALGTIVSANGQIVTQATGLSGFLECVLPDGAVLSAKLAARDEDSNLVLLKIDVKGLHPVEWAEAIPAVGAWVVTAGSKQSPMSIGVVSTEVHARVRALLGIRADQRAERARISAVTKGQAAEAAGIRDGDVVVAVGDKSIGTWGELVVQLGAHKPGDEIQLRLLREAEELSVTAKLRSSGKDVRKSNQEGLWGPLSEVRGGFFAVLQHDSVLLPEQCGGPLVDLDGKVVGINIARVGRVETVAIPVPAVRKIVRTLQKRARSL